CSSMRILVGGNEAASIADCVGNTRARSSAIVSGRPRNDPLVIPRTDRPRDEFGVIAHREVIPPGNYELLCIGKQRLPARRKSERVVSLSENREHRQTSKRTSQGAADLLVHFVAAAHVAQIRMKRADRRRVDSPEKRAARLLIEMSADAEGGRRDPRHQA